MNDLNILRPVDRAVLDVLDRKVGHRHEARAASLAAVEAAMVTVVCGGLAALVVTGLGLGFAQAHGMVAGLIGAVVMSVPALLITMGFAGLSLHAAFEALVALEVLGRPHEGRLPSNLDPAWIEAQEEVDRL